MSAPLKRRTLSQWIGAAALLGPRLALGQASAPMRRIAILEHGDRAARAANWGIFEDRLRQLGYIEGRNLIVIRRWADGVDARLATLAQELLAAEPQLVLVNTTPATQALMRLTRTVPIVFTGAADPVATGLVASLARPGGNVTGFSWQLTDVNDKRLSLMRELVPRARRFALLGPGTPGVQAVLARLQASARSHGAEVRLLEAGDAGAIERAFESIQTEPVDALLVASALVAHNRQIIALAARHRIPASYIHREALEPGALLVLGPDADAPYRRAADYAHRILSGAKPAELPVEQPRTFWLGVNLRTAKALGLRVPEAVLIGADQVIE